MIRQTASISMKSPKIVLLNHKAGVVYFDQWTGALYCIHWLNEWMNEWFILLSDGSYFYKWKWNVLYCGTMIIINVTSFSNIFTFLKHAFLFFPIWGKMVENSWKKVVRPACRCCKHPKAGWNTQQMADKGLWLNYNLLKNVLFLNYDGSFPY